MSVQSQPPPEYTHLSQFVVQLNIEWKTYDTLFCVSKDRVDMFNWCAPNFFRIVQDSLLRAIVLGVSRLTDPCATRSNDNLVLSLLTQRPLVDRVSLDVARGLRKQLHDINVIVAPFRKLRNKRIAHSDRTTFLMPPATGGGVTRNEIGTCIDAINTQMNLWEGNATGTSVAYDQVIVTTGAEAILSTVRRSCEYVEAEKDGTIPRDRMLSSVWYSR